MFEVGFVVAHDLVGDHIACGFEFHFNGGANTTRPPASKQMGR